MVLKTQVIADIYQNTNFATLSERCPVANKTWYFLKKVETKGLTFQNFSKCHLQEVLSFGSEAGTEFQKLSSLI